MRLRHQLAPRKVTFVKRHTGVIPIPTGGSTKGTTLAYGDWGIRIKGKGVRLTAKQLTTAEEVIKRKIKPIKGAKVHLRVFPHLPVCVKVCCVINADFTVSLTQSRETKLVWERERVRLSIGQRGRLLTARLSIKSYKLTAFFPGYPQGVSFLRSGELQFARSWLVMVGLCCCSLVEFLLIVHVALRQAGDKLPTIMEFINKKTPPRLGNLLLTPELKERLESSPTSTSS